MDRLLGQDEDGRPIPFDDAQMRLAVDLIHSAHPASRFSLFGIIRDQAGEVWDLELVGRGLQWEGEAIAYVPSTPYGRSMLWTGSSAQTLVNRYGRKYDLHLAWIDKPRQNEYFR
ncbi:MAG TPA: hypothetical protein VJX66_25965 [Amycolatopsis sp.]|nr:hypothetical protein [Amycolatopsis sp.]